MSSLNSMTSSIPTGQLKHPVMYVMGFSLRPLNRKTEPQDLCSRVVYEWGFRWIIDIVICCVIVCLLKDNVLMDMF